MDANGRLVDELAAILRDETERCRALEWALETARRFSPELRAELLRFADALDALFKGVRSHDEHLMSFFRFAAWVEASKLHCLKSIADGHVPDIGVLPRNVRSTCAAGETA